MLKEMFDNSYRKYLQIVCSVHDRYNYNMPKLMRESYKEFPKIQEKINQFTRDVILEQNLILEGSTYEDANPKYRRNALVLEALKTMESLLENPRYAYNENMGILINKDRVGVKSAQKIKDLGESMKNKGMAKLFESEIEKAEIVLGVKAMTDELQDMAEKISKMQVEDISALTERLKAQYGVQQGDAFQQEINGILATVLGALQAGKSSIDNKALEISGDTTGAAPGGMAGAGPVGGEAPLPSPGGEQPIEGGEEPIEGEDDDMFGGADAAAGPEEEPLGRKKKTVDESRWHGKKVKKDEKKKLKEGPSMSAALNKFASVKPMMAQSKVAAPVQAAPAVDKSQSDAFSPDMKGIHRHVLHLANQADLAGNGEIKTADELEQLNGEIKGMIEELKGHLGGLHHADHHNHKTLSKAIELLALASEKLNKAKHNEMHTELENMMGHMQNSGMTETKIYRKMHSLLEKATEKKKKLDDKWGKKKDEKKGKKEIKESPKSITELLMNEGKKKEEKKPEKKVEKKEVKKVDSKKK